ncbi:GAF domain-containing protein [Streptomyces sp. 3212.3]|nr:GAF domain-containing protein [Streptomyces sp. 3212.3]
MDASPGTWIDHDPARAQKIREYGMHSLMIVPIIARRAVLGVAVFLRTEHPVPFREDDLLLAEELVTRAALSLDNARQYAREHTTALALQRNPLPHRLTGGAAVEVAWRYLPADAEAGVGGDWFDVIPLSGARVGLVVGDVVGHGINAAATMGTLRTAVRTLANMELPPDELLAHLDDTFQRLAEEDANAADQIPTVVGATCLYAVYNPITRRCTMARAGHPPPAIIGPQGRVTFPDLPTGPTRHRPGHPLRGRGAGTARGKSARPVHRRPDRNPRRRHRRGNALPWHRPGTTQSLPGRPVRQSHRALPGSGFIRRHHPATGTDALAQPRPGRLLDACRTTGPLSATPGTWQPAG